VTAVPAQEADLDRIWTIPNVITFVRLAMLPVFLWLLFAEEDRAAAAALAAVLGITDFLDGYIARHFHQESNLGKVLDPVADRLLFFVVGGGILIDGSVPVAFAVVVLVREVAVAVATLVLAAKGAGRIDVTWWGKAGTLCLMVSFPLFLASESSLEWPQWVAWGWGLLGVAFSYYSAWLYVPLARRALAEGRGRLPER
jgi:cardiolipin synthase (CMP-forming)